MALQVSTRFKQLILGPHAFSDIFLNGSIAIYTGTQPAYADSSATGTLLARITQDGGAWTAGSPTNGLKFTLASGYVLRDPAQQWRMNVTATGTAGWWRLYANSPDSGQASFSYPRVDGGITAAADVTAELRLSTVALTSGTQIDIQSFLFTIPPIYGV